MELEYKITPYPNDKMPQVDVTVKDDEGNVFTVVVTPTTSALDTPGWQMDNTGFSSGFSEGSLERAVDSARIEATQSVIRMRAARDEMRDWVDSDGPALAMLRAIAGKEAP